ncbi:ketopantoate reductase family protein [Alteromonas gilva]|uniref:2-dehydropantoate 2-reductase n=1 Tax=Alteromonas gilva TaxID=2987522 RepID=A0ABT5L3N6_9ALTE|nr:2-dehydropantoate 2-reductase [Alteromonas gilva]MDC8831646.1 2-dehydropantoate 2-reductase [Alteromonas gilva]
MSAIVNILGSGAIGGLCAAGAQQAGVSYRLLPRASSALLQTVVLQNSPSHDSRSVSLQPLADSAPAAFTADDILILPLKVFQLKAAIAYWQPKLTTDTPIILLHNGMGGMELAAEYLPLNPVYLATTSHGAFKTTATTVQHTGVGKTMLGLSPLHSASASLNTHIGQLLHHCIGPVTWRDDILLALWQKLAINCAINPLTAQHNVRNGALSSAVFRPTIEAVVNEVCEVAVACGIELRYSVVLAQVFEVIQLTATNYSSMHQDVAHQRPTEIDAITGYIIAQANKKGIDVTTNTLLYNAIKNA